MTEQYSRHIKLDNVINFRDIGGYSTKDSKTVAWQRVYRCGEMHLMTESDITLLTKGLEIASVIDLRGQRRVEQTGFGPLNEMDIKHYHIPLTIITDAKTKQIKEQFQDTTFANMGEVYLYRIRDEEYVHNIIEALEIIAEKDNHPLVQLYAPYQLIDDIQWEPTSTNSCRTVNDLYLLFSNQQYLVVQSVIDGRSLYVVPIDDILYIKVVDSEK